MVITQKRLPTGFRIPSVKFGRDFKVRLTSRIEWDTSIKNENGKLLREFDDTEFQIDRVNFKQKHCPTRAGRLLNERE